MMYDISDLTNMQSKRAIFNTVDKEKQIWRVKEQYSTLMIKRNKYVE